MGEWWHSPWASKAIFKYALSYVVKSNVDTRKVHENYLIHLI